jgi:hypothetical protein
MDATGPLNEQRALGESIRGESVGAESTGAAERPAVKQPALTARDTADPGVPEARGLYDPALDKDSCGVGFIADIKGRKSHQIVEDALTILVNLEHRGAVGADPRAGDGAGILVQMPHKFFAKKAAELGFALPALELVFRGDLGAAAEKHLHIDRLGRLHCFAECRIVGRHVAPA